MYTATQVEKQIGGETVLLLKHGDSVLDQTQATLSGIQTSVSLAQQNIQTTTTNLNHTLSSLTPVADKYGVVAQNINATLLDVHRPCNEANTRDNPYFSPYFSEGATMPCGFLADTDKALNTFRGTMGVVEVGGRHWDKNLGMLDQQEATLFQDFDSLSRTYITTGANLNVITQNMGVMSTDANHKFHDFLYPPPCKNFKCKLVHVFNDVRVAGSLAEPTYWADQLVKGAKP